MINAQTISDLLNDALKTDPAAITLLFNVRRACNKSLADHPYIQVGAAHNGPLFTVSFIGLINGILGYAHSDELVAIIYDDNTNQNIVGFKVVHKNEVTL